MSEIVDLSNESLPVVPDSELNARREQYIRRGLEGAQNTVRGYASDLRHYRNWCQQHNLVDLPATSQVLTQYLTAVGPELKWATLGRRLAAIRKWHQLMGQPADFEDASLKALLKGIQREHAQPQHQAPAFELETIKNRLRAVETESQGVPLFTALRDKVLLLVGFAGAFRRSELVALDTNQVQFDADGAMITQTRSKTNQLGQRETKVFFYSPERALCPVRMLQEWIRVRELETGTTDGPLFVRIRKGNQVTTERLSDKAVDRITKQYLGEEFSAHSLRASFVTISKLNGAVDSEIMQQTGHKTTEMIRRYTRVQNARQHNAGRKLNL
ncbi:site-specific integrase [Larkinella harenae]